MRKSEIIQLALIIFGILIIVRTLETMSVQTSIMLNYQNNNEAIYSWIFAFIGVILLMTVVGYMIIVKSEYLSGKIIKDKDESESVKSTVLTRNEAITIAVIVLSMYFIITGFPAFISSSFTLLTSFFSDFLSFKEIFPGQIWGIVQYFLIILIFMKSNYISDWIESKLMTNAK